MLVLWLFLWLHDRPLWLVDDVLDASWHRAFLLVPAVAFGRFCVGFPVDGLGIMG